MSVGQLFTGYFVTHGIRETAEWQDSDAAFPGFRVGFGWKHETFMQYQQPNEAVTEQDLIRPTLELFGWTDYLPRQDTNRNEDDATSQTLKRPRQGR